MSIVGGRQNVSTVYFDDTKSQLDPNKVKIAVQEAIDALDLKQDLDDFYKILDTAKVFTATPTTGTEGEVVLLAKPTDSDAIAIYANGAWSEEEIEAGDTYLVSADSATEANSVAVVTTSLEFEFIAPEEAGIIFQASEAIFYGWNETTPAWESKDFSLKKATDNKTFYVSQTGSHTNPGTLAEPFLNFTRASLSIAAEWDFNEQYDCEILAVNNLTSFGNFNTIYAPRGIKNNKGLAIGSVDPDNPRSITFRETNGFTANDTKLWIKNLIIIGTQTNSRGVIRYGGNVVYENVTYRGLFESCNYGQGAALGRIGKITIENVTAQNFNFADGLTIDEFLDTVKLIGTNTFSNCVFRGLQKSGTFLRGYNLDDSEGTIVGRSFLMEEQALFSGNAEPIDVIRSLPGTLPGKLIGSSVAIGLPANKAYSNLIIGGLIASGTANTDLNVSELYYEIYNSSNRLEPSWQRIYRAAQTITLTSTQLATDGLKYVVATVNGVGLVDDYADSTSASDRLYLGAVNIANGAIAEVTPFLIENNPNNGSSNLLFYGGIVNRRISPFPKPGTRSFSIPAGNFEVPGSNYFTNPSDPHKYPVPFQDIVTYDLYTPDKTLITANETELDFSQYWDGTALQTVASTEASVVYFYHSSYRLGNKVVAIVGTTDYESISQARSDWRDREKHVPPDWLEQPSKLILTVVGRVNYTTADQEAAVSFNPNLDF